MAAEALFGGLTEAQSQALSLDFLRDPAGLECIVNYAHGTTYQQEVLAEKLDAVAAASRTLSQETTAYRALFTTMGTMLGESVFKEVAAQGGTPVYSDNGETYYTRVIRAAHTAGGQRLKGIKTEYATVKDEAIDEAVMLADGLSSYFLSNRGDKPGTLQVLGILWRFRPGYLVESSTAKSLIYGKTEHLLDYRKHINGGNTPRIGVKVEGQFATPEDIRRLLGVLAVVRQF